MQVVECLLLGFQRLTFEIFHCSLHFGGTLEFILVVVRIMVLFWISIIIRHLICRVPEKGP